MIPRTKVNYSLRELLAALFVSERQGRHREELVALLREIAHSFQWRAILAQLSPADPVWFFAGGGASIIAYWLVRVFRWHVLLRSMHANARFLDLYLYSAIALSVAIFTPFQSGEVLKVELFKKRGNVGRLPGYSAFMV